MKIETASRRHTACLPVLAAACALVGLLAGCGSRDTSSPAPGPSTPTATTSATPATGVVGRWERTVTCQELTSELTRAGLGPTVPYAWAGQTSSTGQSSFAAGSPTPTRARPCNGALPRTHSHFFSASGLFGSLDWLGGQVDDGSYKLSGENALRIGAVTFHYRLVNGDTLFLTPVVTRAMIRQASAHPKDYSDAGWAVSVAYEGHPWKRVPCEERC
jgi:hypothetical protein